MGEKEKEVFQLCLETLCFFIVTVIGAAIILYLVDKEKISKDFAEPIPLIVSIVCFILASRLMYVVIKTWRATKRP